MRRPDGFVWMAVLALCSAVVVVCPWPAPALAEDPLARIYGPPLPGGKVRTYYIAAEETAWDYAPSGRDEAMGHPFAHGAVLYTERRGGRIGRVHTKAVYVEYTDGTFATQKRKAAAWAHTGLLGPVLRAEVGDVIRIIFKNKASRPYSLHPHGVLYLKADEGAPGNDGTSLTEKRDDAVPPGEVQVYVWPVPERAGPGPRDPSSVAWLYHSHTDRVRDTNAGLIGAIIVTRRGLAGPDLRPTDVDREFVLLWKIFDENASWYLERDAKAAASEPGGSGEASGFRESNEKHAVNGYIFGNLPLAALAMRAGERVRWYTFALGSEADLHTAHWHGNTVLTGGRRLDVVPLLPGQHAVADMVPDTPGIWMLHCHVDDHIEAGMSARYRVLPRLDARSGARKALPARSGH